jgi:uncharacterized SAM-binding protein YcdF (DUF218 family)
VSLALINFLKAVFLLPTSFLWLLLFGLLIRRRKFGRVLTGFSFLGLLLTSMPVVVGLWADEWEQYPILQTEQLRRFKPQALVVIGGGAINDSAEYQTPMTVNTRTLLRLRYAAKLYRDTALPVLVSGGKLSDSVCSSEAELMASVLIDEFKIPVAWQESKSRNTAENAQFSFQVLKQSGIEKIVLVTQAYHMPRAAKLFQAAGFDVLPAPTASMAQSSDFTWLDFIPTSAAWMNSFLLSYENLAMSWYLFRN